MKKTALEQSGKHLVILAIAALALSIGGSAQAGVLDALGQFGVSSHAASPLSPHANGSSAIVPLSGRGTGAVDPNSIHAGVCADAPVPCNASSGNCECDPFTGTVTASPKFGKGTLTLNMTTDDDEQFDNGNSRCFPSTGLGKLCNSNSCLGLFVTGSLCEGISNLTNQTNGDIVLNLDGIFYIMPSTSTGKAAGASGGGTLAIANDLKIVNGNITSSTGYSALNGSFQLKP